MVEQRHEDPGRRGRPAGRGARTHGQSARSQEHGNATARGSRPSRRSRSRRNAVHGPRTVVPSDRWRPMRRVGDGPQGSLEQASPGERGPNEAEQQAQQTSPKHGFLGRLFQR